MKECTLGLFYFVKFGELLFTFCWTWYSWWNGIAFIKKAQSDLNGNDFHLQIMAVFGIFFITGHFIYMNLLINIRFWLRLSCVSICKKPYNCCNVLCCISCFGPYCTDKWLEKKATIVKWIIFLIFFGVTGYLVR